MDIAIKLRHKAQEYELEPSPKTMINLLDQLLVEGFSIVPVQVEEPPARMHVYIMSEDGLPLSFGSRLSLAVSNALNSILDPEAQAERKETESFDTDQPIPTL